MIGFLLCLALSLLQYPIEDYTYPQPQIPYESQVIEGSVIEGHVVGESIIEDATLQDRSISIVDGETSDPKTSDSFGQQSNNTAPSIDLSDVDAAFDQANPDHVSTTPEKTEVDSALAANELLAPAVLESDTNQQDTEALATSDSTTLLGMTIPNWGYYTLLAIPILGIAVIVLRGGRRSKSTPRRIRNSHVPTPQLEDAPASLGDHDSSGDHACTKSASGRTLAQRGMSIKGLREARKLQTANPDTASFDAIADAASEARNGRVLRNASTPQSHSESTHSQSPKRQKGKTNGSTEPQPDATRLSIQAESLRTRLAEKEQLEEKLKAELNAQARKVERLKVERDELKDHLTSVKCDFQDQIAKRDEEITRLQDIIESLKDDSVSLPPR